MQKNNTQIFHEEFFNQSWWNIQVIYDTYWTTKPASSQISQWITTISGAQKQLSIEAWKQVIFILKFWKNWSRSWALSYTSFWWVYHIDILAYLHDAKAAAQLERKDILCEMFGQHVRFEVTLLLRSVGANGTLKLGFLATLQAKVRQHMGPPAVCFATCWAAFRLWIDPQPVFRVGWRQPISCEKSDTQQFVDKGLFARSSRVPGRPPLGTPDHLVYC